MNREQLAEWLGHMGIDVNDCQSITIGRVPEHGEVGLKAVLYARDAGGIRFWDPTTKDVATEVRWVDLKAMPVPQSVTAREVLMEALAEVHRQSVWCEECAIRQAGEHK